jgi:hypothetical protein
MESNTLCFFSGNISARIQKAYLIDGVAINGVSGGPVIYSATANTIQIVGDVSAYRPNRATGEALPGLLVARDLTHFHSVTMYIQSVDEANKKKEEAEKAALEAESSASTIVSGQEPPEQAATGESPEPAAQGNL